MYFKAPSKDAHYKSFKGVNTVKCNIGPCYIHVPLQMNKPYKPDKPYLHYPNICPSFLLTGSCTSSLNRIRTRLRRWGRSLSRLRIRRAKPRPAGYATKPSLPMAVATSVHIAKRNSVLGAEDECLCGQIR